MTAILTPNFHTFLVWCKERRIKRTSKKTFIDEQGEKYIPVLSKYDILGGVQFSEHEIVKGFKPEPELLELVRTRTI